MLSSYRLGDLVLLDLHDEEVLELLRDFPGSIGYTFVFEKIKNKTKSNIDIITDIVMKHIEKMKHLFPKDIHESTVIHLRLGDVIAGTIWHEVGKRPIGIEQLKQSLAHDTRKKYVIGYCAFSKTSSTNYQECIEKSHVYLQDVLHELNAEHFSSQNADIDFCLAVQAKVFVQGKGMYSKLIADIRKNVHLPTIKTTFCHESWDIDDAVRYN